MTSGRKRKERRRARLERQRAEANTARSPQAPAATNVGGQGANPNEGEGTRAERVLEGVAVARGWVTATTPEKLTAVLNRQVMIAINPASKPREASVAAGVVVKAVGQVMQQEDRDKGISGGVNVSVPVNVGLSVSQPIQQAITADPDYLEYLQQRRLQEMGHGHHAAGVSHNGSSNGHHANGSNGHAGLEGGGHAGPVGLNGHGGAVPDAAARPAIEPGDHRHDSGNGRHPPADGDDAAAAREE
jgi:hypothetical protein